MDDFELDKKKSQRQAWMYRLYFVKLKIQDGLTATTLFTETPTEELKILLEYAIKGIEQEMQLIPISAYDELNKVEKAHDVMVTFINSLVGTGKFPKDKTLQELSESMKILKHFIARQYLAPERQGTPSSESVTTCELRVPVIDGLDEAIEKPYTMDLKTGSISIREEIIQAARAYAELQRADVDDINVANIPKYKRVDLEHIPQVKSLEPSIIGFYSGYRKAIDDIKSKYGDLYIEAKSRFSDEVVEVK